MPPRGTEREKRPGQPNPLIEVGRASGFQLAERAARIDAYFGQNPDATRADFLQQFSYPKERRQMEVSMDALSYVRGLEQQPRDVLTIIVRRVKRNVYDITPEGPSVFEVDWINPPKPQPKPEPAPQPPVAPKAPEPTVPKYEFRTQAQRDAERRERQQSRDRQQQERVRAQAADAQANVEYMMAVGIEVRDMLRVEELDSPYSSRNTGEQADNIEVTPSMREAYGRYLNNGDYREVFTVDGDVEFKYKYESRRGEDGRPVPQHADIDIHSGKASADEREWDIPAKAIAVMRGRVPGLKKIWEQDVATQRHLVESFVKDGYIKVEDIEGNRQVTWHGKRVDLEKGVYEDGRPVKPTLWAALREIAQPVAEPEWPEKKEIDVVEIGSEWAQRYTVDGRRSGWWPGGNEPTPKEIGKFYERAIKAEVLRRVVDPDGKIVGFERKDGVYLAAPGEAFVPINTQTGEIPASYFEVFGTQITPDLLEVLQGKLGSNILDGEKPAQPVKSSELGDREKARRQALIAESKKFLEDKGVIRLMQAKAGGFEGVQVVVREDVPEEEFGKEILNTRLAGVRLEGPEKPAGATVVLGDHYDHSDPIRIDHRKRQVVEAAVLRNKESGAMNLEISHFVTERSDTYNENDELIQEGEGRDLRSASRIIGEEEVNAKDALDSAVNEIIVLAKFTPKAS